jgi:membrane protease YdiL (CAAX protease family)
VSARSIYSTEPARGWLPWAALAPFLGVLFVSIPLVGVSSVLERLQLADAKGDPIGLSGLFAVLIFPFALVGLVVLAWVHVALAVALTSLVFASLHWSPRQHALDTVNIFLFSLFTCAWALRTGNIWGVMGWHSGWNWLLATGFELPVTGLDAKLPALIVKLTARGPAYLTGGAQGPEGSLACTLFFVCAIALLAWSAKRSRHAEGHVA